METMRGAKSDGRFFAARIKPRRQGRSWSAGVGAREQGEQGWLPAGAEAFPSWGRAGVKAREGE